MAKILLIDDDGVARDALEVFLTRAGHSVITAADGGAGEQAFRRHAPDLVVLDRDLPVMSGSAVMKKIREVSAVPVVILTGHDAGEDAERYLKAGATAFLSKGDGLLPALDEIDRVLGVKKAPAVARPAPASAPRSAGKSNGVVLLADDDIPFKRALARLLSDDGYEVLQADDGKRAVQLALVRRPDVAVLDVSMPGLDGVAVLRELAPELPRTGFIMLSGRDDGNVARACLEIGALDYLTKPADIEKLEGIIGAFLRGRRGPAR